MTFGSLFAGIGGFDLGMARAGLRCAWQVEIDPDAQRVLRHHWPDVLLRDDVRHAGRKSLPAVEVMTGGFPCQDLSVAGKQAGLRGKRSGLFFQMMRVVNELRPGVVVIENVPGLRSSPPGDPGRDFETVLQTVASLGVYECGWTGLDAQWFGVAQRRQRVFLVFARRDLGAGRAAEILALAESRRRHPATRGEAEANLAGTIGSCTPGAGYKNDLDRCGAYVAADLRNGTDTGELAHTVQANGHGACPNGIPHVAQTLRSRQSAPGASPPGRGGEDDVNLVYQCHGSNVGPLGALRAGNGNEAGGVPFVVNAAESCATRSHARSSEVARCLDQTGGFAANQGGTVVAFDPTQITSAVNRSNPQVGDPCHTMAAGAKAPHIATPMMVRRLTPAECCRLQGFPDDWLDLDPPLSDSAKYRLLGNAVVPAIAEWIGRRILAQA